MWRVGVSKLHSILIGSDDFGAKAPVSRNAHRPVVQFRSCDFGVSFLRFQNFDHRETGNRFAQRAKTPSKKTKSQSEINSFDLDDTVDGRNPAPPGM